MKKLVLPIISLIVICILNSIVIASPLKPAIVGGSVVERTMLVRPFTQWESRQRYITGEKIVLFAAPDEGNIWVLRLSYNIHHVDLFTSSGDWETWLVSRTSSIMNNVYSSVMSTLPAGADSTEYYVSMVDDPALLTELGSALRLQFNENFDKILIMRGIAIRVERLTLAEYQSSRD